MRTYSPIQSWILLCLASLLFLGSLLMALSERPGPDDTPQGNPLNIAVEIVGEIPSPGIYSFPKEVTVEQALLEAGGIGSGKTGNPRVFNKALNAGSKIVVARDENHIVTIELARMEPEKCIVFAVPLDLNEVDEEHLTLIPGIGPQLARGIVQYRSKRGDFRKIDELKSVSGIGEKKLRNLERYLAIQGQ
jgi:competence protein ComEA